MSAAPETRAQKMRFEITHEDHIVTLIGNVPEGADPHGGRFATEEAFQELAGRWPMKRLVEIWNRQRVVVRNCSPQVCRKWLGSGANPLGRMRSAFCSLPEISDTENRCPNLGNSSWSTGQLSDLELMLLNLLRKLNSGDRHSSSIESLESEHGADPLFNPAMVLFDDIVQVSAGPDSYSTRQGARRFQFGDCSM
jgi:hypothetical protein